MSRVPPSKAQRIWKRTWIGTLLAATLSGLLLLARRDPSGRFVLAAGAVIALLAALELARLGSFAGRGLRAPLAAAWTALLALALVHETSGSHLPWYVGPAFAAAVAAATARLAGGGAALLAAVLSAWALPPLFELARVQRELGFVVLAVLLVLSKIGDVAGYFVGNAIGRRHPFPRLSPGKTVAGCVGSFVAGALAGALAARFDLLPLSLLGGALLGAWINVAAQAGDLLESYVKRRAGAKDSGSWFGPAGGILDLTDSLLLSVPALLLVAPLAFRAG